jgi:hypothetical protein
MDMPTGRPVHDKASSDLGSCLHELNTFTKTANQEGAVRRTCCCDDQAGRAPASLALLSPP